MKSWMMTPENGSMETKRTPRFKDNDNIDKGVTKMMEMTMTMTMNLTTTPTAKTTSVDCPINKNKNSDKEIEVSKRTKICNGRFCPKH